jgi:hypothetical protein
VWSIQTRPANRLPYVVRCVVDGELHSKSFRTTDEADLRRSRLLIAQKDGERFSPRTGEPETWAPTGDQISTTAWARQWLMEEWHEWAPRTRHSQLEGLSRFLALTVDTKAPPPPPGLRKHLMQALPPTNPVELTSEHERWLARWGLSLGELNEETLADVDRQLGLADSGRTLAPNTARRYRGTARSCLRRAVELKKLPADPWPPVPKGRARRKAAGGPRPLTSGAYPTPPPWPRSSLPCPTTNQEAGTTSS